MKPIYSFFILLFALCACEEILLEDDISGETVYLLAPYDGAVFTSTGVTFSWNSIDNVSRYRLQIARPDFENPLELLTDVVVDTTSFTTQLNIGTYQWRVQGVNSGYTTPFSTRSFTIQSNEDFQNNTVSLSAPVNNLLTTVASQQLQWQPVIGATAYEIRIVRESDDTVIAEETTTETFFPYAFPEGGYQWMVRASNGSVYTLYSSRNLFVDSIPPDEPVLSLPSDQQTLSESEVTFQWSRQPVAGSTEVDSLYIYQDSGLSLLEYKDEQSSPYAHTLDQGTYYWYVRAFDTAGNVGEQSEVFSFTVD